MRGLLEQDKSNDQKYSIINRKTTRNVSTNDAERGIQKFCKGQRKQVN